MKDFPNVELVKFPELDEADFGLVSSALTHFFNKVGADTKLHLSLKQYKKGGLRVQHELHGRLIINGKSFFASHEDWLLLDVLQKVLDKLAKEYKKEFSKKA